MSNAPADQEAFKRQLDQMTAQLVAVERRAKTLAELNHLMSQGRDPLALAQRAVDLVMRATGGSGTFVYLWDSENERLVLRVATTGRQAAHVDQIQLRLGEGVTGWSALMRQVVVLDDDIQTDPRFVSFPILEEEQFRSMVAVPIAVPGGELLGVFTLYGTEPATFDNHDVDLATEVGGLLANGLVQAHTVDDLRRQSAAARFLTTVPAEATSSPQRCVDVLTEMIQEQVEATACTIELADRGTTNGHMRPGLAFSDDVDNATVVAARSVHCRADLPTVLHKLGPALEKYTATFGNLFPLGAITCYRHRPFTETDTNIIEALGTQAAALIASLTNPAITTPLASQLAAASTPDGAERILHDLGWRPGPTHPILVRIQSVKHRTQAAFDRVVEALNEMCGSLDGVVLAPSAPMVSILIPHEPEQWKSFEQTLRNTLKHLRSEAGREISAGIGPVANDAHGLPQALEHAESALAWADLLGDPAVVHYQDLAHLRFLPKVAMDMSEELRGVLVRVAEIVRYDLRHSTALSATLDTYLTNRCSVTDTANELFIHRNTLRQRLGRIEELTGQPTDQLANWMVAALGTRLAVASEPKLAKRSS